MAGSHCCTDCGRSVWARAKRCKSCDTARRQPAKKECNGCGKPFSRMGGGKDARKYCSRECAFNHIKDWQLPNKRHHSVAEYKKPRLCMVWFRACSECGSSFVARRNKQTACSQECRKAQTATPITTKVCITCERPFAKKNGIKYCSPKCRKVANRLYSGAQDIKKRYGVTRKQWDRLRLAALKRDAYVCYICGVDTDERADPNSDLYPNADHVIPVRANGTTTIENLRCSCRACNMLKLDKMPGGHEHLRL